MFQSEDTPEISLHAISGALARQNLRLKRTIGRQSVVVIINLGSTHNFIDPVTARKVGVIVCKDGILEVIVANGDNLTSAHSLKKGLILVQYIGVLVRN